MFSTKGYEADKIKQLNKYDPLYLFQLYLPDIRIGKKFNSPFRKESVPSCVLSRYGSTLLLRDFGLNESFNIITFVAKYFNISNGQAINKILKDMEASSEVSIPLNKFKKLSKPKTNTSILPIRTYRIPFTKEGLKYWKQYGLEEKDLRNIYQIKYYFIFNSCHEVKFGFEYDFGFPYKKLLFPKETKDNKWKSNLRANFIEGLNLLEFKSNQLIITKSYKDTLLLRKFGYQALNPSAESNVLNSFNKNLIANLKTKGFTDIVLFLDNDATGLRYAKKTKEKLGLPYIIIPKYYDSKDISDFTKKYGITKARILIRALLRFGKS